MLAFRTGSFRSLRVGLLQFFSRAMSSLSDRFWPDLAGAVIQRNVRCREPTLVHGMIGMGANRPEAERPGAMSLRKKMTAMNATKGFCARTSVTSLISGSIDDTDRHSSHKDIPWLL
jgi:hypothetical protein